MTYKVLEQPLLTQLKFTRNMVARSLKDTHGKNGDKHIEHKQTYRKSLNNKNNTQCLTHSPSSGWNSLTYFNLTQLLFLADHNIVYGTYISAQVQQVLVAQTIRSVNSHIDPYCQYRCCYCWPTDCALSQYGATDPRSGRSR